MRVELTIPANPNHAGIDHQWRNFLVKVLPISIVPADLPETLVFDGLVRGPATNARITYKMMQFTN